MDHKESPGATTTWWAGRTAVSWAFARALVLGVSSAVATAGKSARSTAQSANAAIGAYAYRAYLLSLANKVFPFT
jgi:hypothetical protein